MNSPLHREIVETLLTYAEKHGLKRIVEVRLTIGELTCVEPDQLKFCFGAITRDSALEDASLEIEIADAAGALPALRLRRSPKILGRAARAAAFPAHARVSGVRPRRGTDRRSTDLRDQEQLNTFRDSESADTPLPATA